MIIVSSWEKCTIIEVNKRRRNVVSDIILIMVGRKKIK
jgi:hypothetical protein